MATAIQWRRGTTAQHGSFTGLVGEITVDTDLDTIRVHDGSTAGGHRLAKFSEIQAGDITGVTAGDGLSGGGTSGAVSLALDLNELTAAAVDVSADSIALIDGGDNSSKKESIADFTVAIAGTGLTATAGVISSASAVFLDPSSDPPFLKTISCSGVIMTFLNCVFKIDDIN